MDDLVELMEEMLAAVPGVEGVWVERWDPPESDPSGAALEAAFADLRQAFEDRVAEVSASWGEPSYRGSAERGDFPTWSEALLLATWERGDAVGFVALRQDDESLPMLLEAGALSRDEIATLALGRP